ncbi:MAG: four helix bundle protein [Chloroflexi bacterium]|nr:four helix bundle protein [Chloroflexota bacterium]
MNQQQLEQRTKQYALRVIRATEALPNTRTGNVIANQLLRCGTSVGANYRSACRARSRPDFISKVGIAIEEADESQYWMELIVEAGMFPEARMQDLMKESDEIIAILTASSQTAKRNQINQQSAIKNQKSK